MPETARKLLADGIDPSNTRKAEKATKVGSAANSFEAIAREWVTSYLAGKSQDNAQRTLRRFELYLFPWIGGKPIAAQYDRTNNGKLVCCTKYLQPLGWTSNDTINRALKELKQSGLVIETRKGMMPPYSRPAWFAIGWFGLDVITGLDIDYKKYQHCQLIQIKALTPIYGVVRQTTAPINGVAGQSLAPIYGAVEAINDHPPTPIYGEFIDLPSTHSIINQHYIAKAGNV